MEKKKKAGAKLLDQTKAGSKWRVLRKGVSKREENSKVSTHAKSDIC